MFICTLMIVKRPVITMVYFELVTLLIIMYAFFTYIDSAEQELMFIIGKKINENYQLFFMFLFYFQQVSHPNIVSLVEEFHTSQHLYLVMELVRVIVFLRLKSYISKKKNLKIKKNMCIYEFIDLFSLCIRVATCLMPLPVLPAIQSKMQAL